MNLNLRRTRPTSGNKYYNSKSKGGYSTCIVGKPTDSQCNVLSNCVGNACAGFNEEHNFGYEKYHLNCNAENFIERAIAMGLSVVQNPVPGGIMVWQKGATLSGSDGAGHVEVVLDILERDSNGKPTKIRNHSSGYGNSNPWWTNIRSIGNGNWGCNSPFKYRGCIAPEGYIPEPVVPTPTPIPQPTPTPSKTIDELAKEVINGKWGNGDERKNRLTSAGYDYNAVQKRVNEILKGTSTQTFKVGDTVVPTRLNNYNGVKLTQYDKSYQITKIDGDRVVLAANRNGKLVTWAAINIKDIKKIG